MRKRTKTKTETANVLATCKYSENHTTLPHVLTVFPAQVAYEAYRDCSPFTSSPTYSNPVHILHQQRWEEVYASPLMKAVWPISNQKSVGLLMLHSSVDTSVGLLRSCGFSQFRKVMWDSLESIHEDTCPYTLRCMHSPVHRKGAVGKPSETCFWDRTNYHICFMLYSYLQHWLHPCYLLCVIVCSWT